MHVTLKNSPSSIQWATDNILGWLNNVIYIVYRDDSLNQSEWHKKCRVFRPYCCARRGQTQYKHMNGILKYPIPKTQKK